MGSDGMPKRVAPTNIWLAEDPLNGWRPRTRWYPSRERARDGGVAVEYRLVDDSLRRALELAEAVKWIEANDFIVERMPLRYTTRTMRWLVRDHGDAYATADKFEVSVAALKAKIGGDGGR